MGNDLDKVTISQLAKQYDVDTKSLFSELKKMHVMVFSANQPIPPRFLPQVHAHIESLVQRRLEEEKKTLRQKMISQKRISKVKPKSPQPTRKEIMPSADTTQQTSLDPMTDPKFLNQRGKKYSMEDFLQGMPKLRRELQQDEVMGELQQVQNDETACAIVPVQLPNTYPVDQLPETIRPLFLAIESGDWPTAARILRNSDSLTMDSTTLFLFNLGNLHYFSERLRQGNLTLKQREQFHEGLTQLTKGMREHLHGKDWDLFHSVCQKVDCQLNMR